MCAGYICAIHSQCASSCLNHVAAIHLKAWDIKFALGQCRVKYETEIFGRQYYGFSGREGERGVDYFTGLLRETDKKEFSFRELESKIVRRHHDEMRVIVD